MAGVAVLKRKKPRASRLRLRRLTTTGLSVPGSADSSSGVALVTGTVVTGVMREYYPLEDGREVTRNFAGPGDGIGSLSDLISGEASKSAIAAETDARIVTVAD